MCGIAGIYNFNKDERVDQRVLKRMGDVMTHRGPDGEGIHIDDRLGIVHRRLSIIDVEGGAQPIFNEDNTVAIVFNGEIYNYMELRTNLEKKGHRFRTNTDTESIIHLYEEIGVDCVNTLRGMFAFALWDKRKNTLFLARDRIGIKPLYYSIQKGSLIFASEIKAILQNPGSQIEIDPDAINDYFSFLFVPAPKTIYKGIYKLKPGYRIVCTPGSCSVDEYWDIIYNSQLMNLSEGEYVEQTLELLKEVIRIHLVSDVPLGAFMSGGIDSSSIVALMQQIMNEPVKTCTVGFNENPFNEALYARYTANFLNTDHHEYFVKPDAIDILQKLVWHLDEPFADASAIPTYYVCRMARENVTVALSGDGGDEIFAGYTSYTRGMTEDRLRKLPSLVRKAICKPALLVMPSSMKGRTFLTNLITSGQRAHINKWSYFNESMKQSIFSNDLKNSLSSLDSFSTLEPFFNNHPELDLLAQCQYVDIKTYLVDDILTKVDKMSMANSLEVRVPFLDHVFVEYVLNIPSNMKLRGKVTKYLLKRCMARLLPETVLNYGKKGFLAPVGTWFRKDIKDFAENVLFDPKTRSRGYFNYDYIEKLWNEHLRFNRLNIDISLHLWILLIFEIWHRTFLDIPQIKQSDIF